mgnify:CR=1 FL=1
MRFLNYCVLFIFLFLQVNCKKEDNKTTELFLLFAILNYLQNQSTVASSCSTTGVPSDPLYTNQWHLNNDGTTSGAVSGEDVNANSAWEKGCKGNGVNIVTVDDGMDYTHEDLKSNYDNSLNITYSSSGESGLFNYSNCSTTGLGCHGTAVSGIMSARDSNGIGLSGIAPRSKIGARNVLVNSTDSNASSAMSQNSTKVWVSNNSWGAADNTGRLASSGSLWQSGVNSGFTSGRNGKGTIYFWAAGNGGQLLTSSNTSGIVSSGTATRDNSNHDGQANFYNTFAVAAIGNDGKRAYYSEEGANLLITAHSQGLSGGPAIATTDIASSGGYNTTGASPNFSNTNYTNSFNGTSASSPLAAGVGALILERNSNLTSRDVRVILARAARKNDSTDSDWVTNGAGLNFNHKYGFGAVHVGNALTLADSWTLIGSLLTSTQTGSTTNSNIPNNNQTGALNSATLSNTGIGKIEFVEVTMTVQTGTNDDAGDLYVELISPAGTKARLAVPRICTSNGSIAFCNDFTAWTFGATTFVDESANGTWQLRVADVCTKAVGGAGTSNYTCDATSRYTQTGSSFVYSTSKNIANLDHTLSSWSIRVRGRAN